MNETNHDTELDSLRREAVDWIQRLASGTATVADGEALKRWCLQSPAHAAAYADASRLWKEFGPAARNLRRRGEISPGLAHLTPRSPTPSRRLVLGGGFAVGAAACGYAVINPPFGLWPSFEELTADYRTATGEQREIALAADVSVLLNTQTSIVLRAPGESADNVELVAGEASFATTAPDRLFAVLAADGRAAANNARFDVRRVGAVVCVTCTEGNVRVEYGADATAIGPRQQIRYDKNGLGHVATVDPELVTAWQQGVLIFRLTPLADVEEINRYRPGKVILLNAALGRKPVSGRFRIDHMDEVLLRLDQAFGAKSRSLPGGIVLLS
jgi:transmembrane sensor